MYSLQFFSASIIHYSWYLNSRDLNGHCEYSFILIKCDEAHEQKNTFSIYKRNLRFLQNSNNRAGLTHLTDEIVWSLTSFKLLVKCLLSLSIVLMKAIKLSFRQGCWFFVFMSDL